MENLKLEAIDHKGLWANVMSNLTKSILNGELKPGDQLVESTIAEHMQVSRGPVRDALIRLEHEGLVENIPRKGTFVRKLNKEDFKQIYELRTSLESLGIRLSIEKLDKNTQLVSSLRNIAKEMGEAAREEDIVRTADLDLEFHQTICESSSNRYLVEAWTRISKVIRLCLITDLVFKNYGRTEQDHNLIIEAIAEESSNLGEERIKSHIASSSTLLFGE